MNTTQLQQITRKQIINLLKEMECPLVSGEIVPANQFDFKSWKKDKIIEHYLGTQKFMATQNHG